MVAAERVVAKWRWRWRRECEGRRRVAVWGLRTEITKGKARIPMIPARWLLVLPQMGDKIGFIKFSLFISFSYLRVALR